MDTIVRGFLIRYSGTTRKTYESGLRKFLNWCEVTELDHLQATRIDLETYSLYLREETELKTSTVAGYLSVIKIYYRVLEADGTIISNPASMLRVPVARYDEARLTGLSKGEISALFEAARSMNVTREALLVLMCVLGLRVSEAGNVKIEDFQDIERGHRVLRVKGKGGRYDSIPLPPLVARILDKCAGDRDKGYLITTSTGKKLTRHDAYRWVATIARRARIRNVHPHLLRHTAITSALDAGASIRDAQVFARHSDPRLTVRYDRNRKNLDRHSSYLVSSYLSGSLV